MAVDQSLVERPRSQNPHTHAQHHAPHTQQQQQQQQQHASPMRVPTTTTTTAAPAAYPTVHLHSRMHTYFELFVCVCVICFVFVCVCHILCLCYMLISQALFVIIGTLFMCPLLQVLICIIYLSDLNVVFVTNGHVIFSSCRIVPSIYLSRC